MTLLLEVGKNFSTPYTNLGGKQQLSKNNSILHRQKSDSQPIITNFNKKVELHRFAFHKSRKLSSFKFSICSLRSLDTAGDPEYRLKLDAT